MQGAGKTTLLKALLNKCKPNIASKEDAISEVDVQEAIADGLCYCDSAGVNMQVFDFSFCPYFFPYFPFAFLSKWPLLYPLDSFQNICIIQEKKIK